MTASLCKMDHFLGGYRPLIPNGEFSEIRFYMNSDAGVRASLQNKDQVVKELFVEGYPRAIASDPFELRRYVARSYCVFVKTPGGKTDYLSLRPQMKGGGLGISEEDILPCYPGYALGSVIHRSDYLFPQCFRKLQALNKEKEHLELEKAEAKKKKSQDELNMIIVQLSKIEREQAQMNSEFEKLSLEIGGLNISETLPIDYNQTQMKQHEHSFESEETNFITFQSREGEHLEEKIRTFVLNLVHGERLTPYLASGTMNQLVERLKITLNECSSVTLLGSFVTTKKVKKMDPIVLRKAGLSERLRSSAREYYVLTEAVLGGLFLGFGEDHQLDSELPINKKVSQILVTSFISQGAISEFGQQRTLWDAFISWKNQIRGEGTGYPVGFKVRKLAEILMENGIECPPNREAEELGSGSNLKF
ncbi:MAG: hypothetical protein IT584_03520 [Chlamydiae bacterium]|nr:hypothetical protein [Chlamydiota bacterium]